MAKDFSMHSPAGDMTSGFGVGGGSKPAPPSYHPSVNVSGVTAQGTKSGNEFGKASANAPQERTPISVEEVQFAGGIPDSGEVTSLGPTMAGGLGNPPRP